MHVITTEFEEKERKKTNQIVKKFVLISEIHG